MCSATLLVCLLTFHANSENIENQKASIAAAAIRAKNPIPCSVGLWGEHFGVCLRVTVMSYQVLGVLVPRVVVVGQKQEHAQ